MGPVEREASFVWVMGTREGYRLSQLEPTVDQVPAGKLE